MLEYRACGAAHLVEHIVQSDTIVFLFCGAICSPTHIRPNKPFVVAIDSAREPITLSGHAVFAGEQNNQP